MCELALLGGCTVDPEKVPDFRTLLQKDPKQDPKQYEKQRQNMIKTLRHMKINMEKCIQRLQEAPGYDDKSVIVQQAFLIESCTETIISQCIQTIEHNENVNWEELVRFVCDNFEQAMAACGQALAEANAHDDAEVLHATQQMCQELHRFAQALGVPG